VFSDAAGRGRACVGAGDDGYYCFALEPRPDGKAEVLWHAGSWDLAVEDIADWPGWLAVLQADRPAMARRLWAQLGPELRLKIAGAAGRQPPAGLKAEIAAVLNAALDRPELAEDPAAWPDAALDSEIRKIMGRLNGGGHRTADVRAVNRALVEAAFPSMVRPAARFLDAESSPLAVTPRQDSGTGSPGGAGVRIVAGLGVGGRAVVCLDAETGAELWRRPTPYPVFAAPSAAEREGRTVVLVGMGSGTVLETAEAVGRTEIERLRKGGGTLEQIEAEKRKHRPGGAVWCLDAVTGDPAWKFETGEAVLGAVAVGPRGVYFGARDGSFRMLPLDGAAGDAARFDAGEPIVTSPALTAEHVYFVTAGGRLWCLDAADLRLEWDMRLGWSGAFLSSPAVGRGRLYVGSESQGLLCAGRTGERRVAGWGGFMAGPGMPGYAEPSALPAGAILGWCFPPSAPEGATQRQARVVAPAAFCGGRLFVPVASGDCGAGIACLDTRPELRADDPARLLWFRPLPGGAHCSPAVSPGEPPDGVGRVYAAGGREGDAERRLFCLSPASGEVLWTAPLPPESRGEPLLLPGGVLMETRPGRLAYWGADGTSRWEFAVAGPLAGGAAAGGELLVAATADPPRLEAFRLSDLPGGRAVWSADLAEAPVTGPAPDGKAVYVGDGRGVAAFKAADGEAMWRADAGRPRTRLAVGPSGILAYVNEASELVAIDVNAGEPGRRVVARIAGARPEAPPVVCREGILYRGPDDIMFLPAGEQAARRWMAAGWLGEPTSAMILADSRVYFGTARLGLVCGKERR
jgi:outer membrane protein assembly factor BamB